MSSVSSSLGVQPPRSLARSVDGFLVRSPQRCPSALAASLKPCANHYLRSAGGWGAVGLPGKSVWLLGLGSLASPRRRLRLRLRRSRRPEARGRQPAQPRFRSLCRAKPRDWVCDFVFPTLTEVESAFASIEPLASFVSPVFCSAGPGGIRSFGLSHVPTPESMGGRPVLFVGNHQFLSLDLGPLVRELLLEQGIVARGLAYPPVFERVRPGEPIDSNDPFTMGGAVFRFGAVPAGPRNLFQLLQRGEAVLLFPGGIREAAHGPGENYKLFWSEKTDFVRMAARFNAVVVPFGGIGSADNFAIAGRWSDVYGPLVRLLPEDVQSQVSAPDYEPGGGFFPVSDALQSRPSLPLFAPRLLPATSNSPGFGDRFYSSFGRPVDLLGLDPRDRVSCNRVYGEIRDAVNQEIQWLLEMRTKDPYRDFMRRAFYERFASKDDSTRRIRGGLLNGGVVKTSSARAPAFEL